MAQEVRCEVMVAASLSTVWAHWTTLEGLQTLFVPPNPPLQGRVELRPEGLYELYFLMDNPVGMRGSEGARIIAFQAERMLSFTWTNRPDLKEIRPFFTHVLVTLEPVSQSATRIRLVHDGFGDGGEWDISRAYFDEAWKRVLGRLVRRYSTSELSSAT